MEQKNYIICIDYIHDATDGTYEILLTAEDAVGNKSYSSIILYIQKGVMVEYSLIAEITDVKYNTENDSVDIYGTVSGNGHLSGYTLSYKTEGSEIGSTCHCELRVLHKSRYAYKPDKRKSGIDGNN